MDLKAVWGAVLYQQHNKVLCVIAYGSHALGTAEKNYHLHSGKLEFLVLMWAICKQFRDYLYYAPGFVVLNVTGFRCIGELADFNFTIRYRPGKAKR
jgi:hypothetical protein